MISQRARLHSVESCERVSMYGGGDGGGGGVDVEGGGTHARTHATASVSLLTVRSTLYYYYCTLSCPVPYCNGREYVWLGVMEMGRLEVLVEH